MSNDIQKTTHDQNTETYHPHTVYTPRVDVHESQDDYLLVVDLPGMARGDVDVRIARDELTLEAGNEETGRYYHRAFRVPGDIAAEDVAADLAHGVLTVKLPKVPEVKPRAIEVRTS